MDQELKQRLVGVMVITALAAIFVPMLFDDPVDETGKMVSELAIPESPIKSFELSNTKLPESIDRVQAVANIPEEIKTLESTPVAEELQRWFVQVATFNQKENALKLRTELRKQGYKAFYEAVEKGPDNTMYRLRVGPVLSRQKAEDLSVKLNKLKGINSIIVSE